MNYEFVRYLPSFAELRAVTGELIIGNDRNLSIQGFGSLEEAEGTGYCDFKCDAVAMQDSFEAQNKLAIRRKGDPQYFLSYCKYSHGEWIATFGSKTLIYQDQKPYAILCTMDYTQKLGLLDLSRFVFKESMQAKAKKNQFDYSIDEFKDNFSLTEREKQVVFYLLRGKTSKAIAEVLHISKRTSDFHIENLKLKLGCNNKEALIEKLMVEGYLSLLPKSILFKQRI